MDMNITGPQLQGAKENVIDQPDNRRSIYHVKQVVRTGYLVNELVEILRIKLFYYFLDDRRLLLVGDVYYRGNSSAGGYRRTDRQAHHLRDGVPSIRIQR